MRSLVKPVHTFLIAISLVMTALTASLVGCEDEEKVHLPPYDPDDSKFSGIGGLPPGGGGEIAPGGGGQTEEEDAGTADVDIPDSGEIEFFPDANGG